MDLPNRPIYLSSPLVVPLSKSDLTIRGGPRTEIVPLTTAGYLFRLGWTTGSPHTLDSNTAPTKRTWIDNCAVKAPVATAVRGSSSVTFASAPSTAPSPGDVWILYDLVPEVDRTLAAPYTNTIGNHTWLFVVLSYNPATLTATVHPRSGTCPHTFGAGAAAARLTGEATYGFSSGVTIEGVRFRMRERASGAKVSYGLIAQCCLGLTVRGCTFEEWNDWPLDLHACTDVLIEDCSFFRGQTSGTGRGIGLHACSNVVVRRPCADRFHRHLVVCTEGSRGVLVEDGFVEGQAAETDASWDTHGTECSDVTFRRCRNGWVHIGNDSFVKGDQATVEDCDVHGVRIQGGCQGAVLRRTRVAGGIEISSKKTPDNVWYRGTTVSLESCAVGSFPTGGCLRLVNSPGLASLTLTDCVLSETSPTSAGTIEAVDFVNTQTVFSLTIQRCVVASRSRSDGVSVVRWWGAGTTGSSLSFQATDSWFLCRNAKPFEFRQTAWSGGGTASVSNCVLGGSATSAADMFQQKPTAVTVSASGNVFLPV